MKIRLFLLGMLLSGVLHAEGLVITPSPHDVDTTMSRLQDAVKARGLGIFTLIDHAAGAQKAGMQLAPYQVLLFGNPKLGTLLMQAKPAVGLDLPMKIAIWQDGQGNTQVAYRSADDLAAAYGLDPQSKPLGKVRGALAGLVKTATAP